MKRKLHLLMLTMLFSVSFMQAQKTDVWDLGGQALDANLYNNKLTVANINAWYPGITAGTSGVTLPNSTVLTLTAGVLTLTTGGSDRLYTTNPDPTNNPITRYATGSIGTTDTNYTARYYCNGAANNGTSVAAATSRFFTMTLNADDEVTVVASTESAGNSISVSNLTTGTQNQSFPVTISGTGVTLVKFVAKEAGNFKIVSLVGKGNYYRIYRKAVTPVTLTGNMDVTAAPGIPGGYSVLFTNTFTGKTYNAPVNAGTYSVSNVPAGFTYKMSLVGANGYLISNGENFTVTDATTVTHDISVLKVVLYTVSGNVTGLGTKISNATLVYTPSTTKVFVPQPVINTGAATYTVDLEDNVPYTISATGINDFELLSNTITATAATTSNLDFTAKPVYPVTINTTGLTPTQLGKLTLTFTNLNESGYVYNYPSTTGISLRDGTYAVTYGGLTGEPVELKLISNLKVNGAAASKDLNFKPVADTSPIPYAATITVGTDKTYKTINEALAAVARMTRTTTTTDSDRVTIMVDPGNYEEMIVINKPNITLKNASSTPSIGLLNQGVDIDPNAVRITSYYGLGYNYFSQGTDNKWSADALAVNKENGYTNYTNVSGTTNASYWNATVVVNSTGFVADQIIIENSYNQYISKKESEDVIVLVPGNKGVRPTTKGSVGVQNKSFVERAAAIGIPNNTDKVVLNKCRVVGRQDSFFGGSNARVVVYKGVMMGATDYLFGGMNAVFYQTDLAMNTSEDSNDTSYITAAQQTAGRGYLMYECKVTSAIPGTETASIYRSKPGYFGRPWQATTSEVVFYKTTIETSNNINFLNQSLIVPLGWNNSLNSAQSAKMYEYGTIENSGVNNATSRAAWATLLSVPTLTDNTPITTKEFTKGSDNWDPIPALIAADPALGTQQFNAVTAVNATAYKNNVVVSNVKSSTKVLVYGLNGALVKTLQVNADTSFNLNAGIWIVVLKDGEGQKSVKLMTY
ncbi:pectinesterase family protein [Flavobacterium limnophilum]|uniref:pectinesterase family protein n=1 Tax=Flavobacterium limnophilum TaxID=3003262 RepID=UPI00248252D2|nr:pectinesterase family protein [Flavobacterium limnophilum]